MLILIAHFAMSIFAADFELPKPSDYKVDGYWEYGFGLATMSATQKHSDAIVNGLSTQYWVEQTFSGYGPQFEIKRGVSLDDAAFFEVGTRLSYFSPGSATYKDELQQTLTIEARGHTIAEILLGGGYTMTYVPARWYGHFFGQFLKTNTDANFGNPGNGFRFGLGYYFNLSSSLAIEYSSITNTVPYKNTSNQTRYASYAMSMISLNFTVSSPTTPTTEPWKRKYQNLSDD